MTSDKVSEWEREACEIASHFESERDYGWEAEVVGADGKRRTNIKPWYSPRSAFRQKGGVVVIGANPAGPPSSPPDDSIRAVYQANLERPDYNAYLCESWNGKELGCHKLQLAVKRVFKLLYGNEWEQRLRDAACFNVCPLRTRRTNEEFLPSSIWLESKKWSTMVVNKLEPELIICVGDAVTGKKPIRSAWCAIGPKQTICECVGEKARFRVGYAEIGESHVAKVVGIPHPTGAAYDPKRLEAAIQKHRVNILESPIGRDACP